MLNSSSDSRGEESDDKNLWVVKQCLPSLLVCSLCADMAGGHRGASIDVHCDAAISLWMKQVDGRDLHDETADGIVAILNTALGSDRCTVSP